MEWLDGFWPLQFELIYALTFAKMCLLHSWSVCGARGSVLQRVDVHTTTDQNFHLPFIESDTNNHWPRN